MFKLLLDALAVCGMVTLAILVWGLVKIYHSEQPQKQPGRATTDY
jgi:hypothetical protein